MGFRLTASGTTYTRYIDIVDYPITSNLSSLFYIGTDSVSSSVNHGSTANATGGGVNITYFPGYGLFAGANTNINSYLQTSDPNNSSSDMTLCALVARQDINGRTIWGTYNAAVDGASLIYLGASLGNGTLVTGAFANAAPDTKFYFQAMLISGTSLIPYTGIDGQLVAGVAMTATRVQSASAARIGGGYANGSFNGVLKISAVSKHTRALSLSELAEVYFYFKSRATKLGLTVS